MSRSKLTGAAKAYLLAQSVRSIMSRTKEYTKEQLEQMDYNERHEILLRLKAEQENIRRLQR